MFEVGKRYKIVMIVAGDEETSYVKIDEVSGTLIKSGNTIINTQSSAFISAELSE